MDSAINTAARALSVADPLTALKYVALRSDPPALALRGIAMAQLGELTHAKALLGRAVRRFGASDPLARARSVVAHAEVALAFDNQRSGRRLHIEKCRIAQLFDNTDRAIERRPCRARWS